MSKARLTEKSLKKGSNEEFSNEGASIRRLFSANIVNKAARRGGKRFKTHQRKWVAECSTYPTQENDKRRLVSSLYFPKGDGKRIDCLKKKGNTSIARPKLPPHLEINNIRNGEPDSS